MELPDSSLVFLFCCRLIAIPHSRRFFHSQHHLSQGTGGEGDDIATRMSMTSPARDQTSRSSVAARSPREDEEMSARKPGTSSRQRPLSAPPKAYPFSRDLGVRREHGSPGKVEYREATAVGVGKGDTGGFPPREAGRSSRGGGDRNDSGVGAHGGHASAGSVDTRSPQQRLSLTSIFGTASERRASEEKRPSIRSSLLPDANDRCVSRGAAQTDLQDNSEKGGSGKVDSTAVATLRSQDFGLHQWKEYAVLR